MRILYVIDSLGPGGTERSTVTLLPRLRARGHDVAVATLYEAEHGDEGQLRADGFDVRPLIGQSFLARIRELRQRVAEFGPDIIHTALFNSDIIGRLAAWRSGAVVVSSLVNTPYDARRLAMIGRQRWKVRGVQFVDALSAHLLVDHLHAVSQGVAQANARALRLEPSKITVVERGRDPDQLGQWSSERRQAVRERLEVPNNAKVVLAVGRQEHQKNHVDLVRAIDRLVDELPGVIMFIAGRPGSATRALHECLDEHPGAATVTRLLGHRRDVPDLLCAADALVIPSIYEGTAGAAIEAMALNCPIACAGVPGVAGILEDHRNALLVEPGDAESLADGIRDLLSNEGLPETLRIRGRRDFELRFTIEAAAARMEHFYAKLLSDARMVVS